VAGAALVADTERMMRDAGLVSVFLEPKPEYLQALNSANDPFYQNISGHLPAGTTPADYVTSLNITARKPL
jgi:arsenite methyltransferase